MKSSLKAPVGRIRLLLTAALAAPLTLSSAFAETTDADNVRRLQDENATLRKKLAELEGKTAAAETAATNDKPAASTSDSARPSQAFTAASGPASESDQDMIVLSPFEVKGERDYGYLKTNAATATRIGMEIQRVPMNISVMSEDFIKDTGVSSITDVLRYTASGSPDSRFAMRVPGNSSTPQGNFTMRGFTVNSLLRNGIFRYTSYNLDNVDRVEIVKGPAAVFFGQGYPGGVINYITKKPVFEKESTSISYAIDDNGGDKVVMDHNAPLSSKAAFRVVGAWSDLRGDRKGEFRDNFNLTPSLTLVPLKSGKLRINMEFEYLKETYNQNDGGWIWPQGWFDAYANPSAELLAASGAANAAAYRTRIFNSPANWITDLRKARNDPALPIYTKDSVKGSGYYTDANGKRVEDKGFNFTNSGSYTRDEVKTFQTTIDVSPFSWVDARYVYTNDNNRFDNIYGAIVPNADGVTFNAASGGAGAGYYRRAKNHQLDLIFKADFWGMKHKLLTGGIYEDVFQQYMASTGAVYFQVPGYNYPTVNPNNLPNPTNSNVPVNQVLRNRAGTVLTAPQVYSMWDPGIHVTPPVSKIYGINRNLLDGYKPQNDALYANWQIQTLKDRLIVLLGYRRESSKGSGQWLTSNDPWFVVPPDAYLNQTTYPPDVYNYTASYSGDPENFRRRSGNAWMTGVSYALTPEISLYATVSKTFKVNSGLAGGFDELSLDTLLTEALAHNNGSFNYRGKSVTSVAEGRAALTQSGAFDSIQNEQGMNYEVGVKTTLWQDKLVSTFSLFRGTRKDQKLDDSQKTSEDPFNYSTTMFDSTSTYYNKRNFRWRMVGVENQIEGLEFETIWTPIRNYQIVLNGAWLWQAETLDFPSYPKPGTTTFKNATAAQQALYTMYYNNRIENVPEYRLNFYNKYTFTGGLVRGLSVSFGGRYSSETIYSRSLDWNPDRGGFKAGNYVVFDASIAYPWEVLGYRLTTTLGMNNVFDEVYYEGSYAPSDGRSWVLRTTVNF
ncbi:hypothetical protein DB347_02160 [Opitutaceae bacterium EW11]|nr:hypothetical protein DB347_02160 [Opitutaceae bacterium EW11]